MNTKDKIAVMMALVDGAKIEYVSKFDDKETWKPTDKPHWDWNTTCYRVAKLKLTCDAPNCNKELYDTCVGSTWTAGNYCSDRCAYIADVMWAFKEGSM